MALYTLDGRRPDMGPDQAGWIAPTSAVIGHVILGKEASIWFGAVLRGDNEPITIGPRSNVQDLTVIHSDPGYACTVGAGVTIGHRAILHGCVIGDNSLIGMGAVVMNGAQIGRNCMIGAHALIPENKIIPDNSLVIGAPGRVARQLKESEIADLAVSADRYVANARRFAAGLEEAVPTL